MSLGRARRPDAARGREQRSTSSWAWHTEDVSTVADTDVARLRGPELDRPRPGDRATVAGATRFPPAVTRVVIEPGGAFGRGDHPTRSSPPVCGRRALERVSPPRDVPVSVLDVGCGTGVLSIVAALSGAAWVRRPVDIAADAVEAAEMNARLNGVADRIHGRRHAAQHHRGRASTSSWPTSWRQRSSRRRPTCHRLTAERRPARSSAESSPTPTITCSMH